MRKQASRKQHNLLSLKQVGSLLLAVSPLLPGFAGATEDARPNVVLLVADDAGYSDFAGFGGEAQTPAMDSLASTGVKLTNFHAMPNCTPSRASFLTGTDNHLNGVGTMQGQLSGPAASSQRGTSGYMGYLNDRTLPVSELLKDAGYHTYMVGKWHLGEEGEVDNQVVFKRGTWPIDRGFEQSFGILNGGADHFGACERVEGTCTRFFENEEILAPTIDFGPGQVGPTPTDSIYFSATAHTDKAIEFIDAGKTTDGERKPFFLYYADTMPHEPNQLPLEYLNSQHMQDLITHYRAQGWDGVRAERFQKMQMLGIIPATMTLPDRYPEIPAWNDENDPNWKTLMDRVTDPVYGVFWTNKNGGPITTVAELKDVLAKKMAIYTGMVEFFDNEVSRLIQHLKNIGEYDNTLFIYFSDNGGDDREWDWEDRDSMLHRGTNNSYDNLGRAGSFFANGPEWAQAVNVPFYGAKATVGEGGLRDAFVAAFPGGDMMAGSQSGAMATVMDVAATILDYAGVQHPVGVGVKADWDSCTGTYNGKSNLCPMSGKSMRTLMQGNATSVHDREPIGYENSGRTAIINGVIMDRPNKAIYYEEDGVVWKLLRLGDNGWGAGKLGTAEPWKLFNLTLDPSESNDLSGTETVRFAQMLEMYNDYEQSVGMIPQRALRQDDVTPGTQATYTFTLTNTGSAVETYSLNCRSDWKCTLSNEGVGITLAPGGTTDISVTVDVPANASGMTRTTQVSMMRASAPQMSSNQVLVTQVAGKLGDTTSGTSGTSGGGGSASVETLLLLLMSGAVFGLRRKKQA